MAASDRKIAEGLEHLRQADKCMKTSLFKWKPDLDGALFEYNKAAVAFKNAKAYEQCISAYLKAADLQRQTGSQFHSAKSLEAAAMICRDNQQVPRAVELIERASLMYLEHGTPDTAAMALERAAKMTEREDPDRAISLYEKASGVVEGEDRPREAGVFIGRAARLLIRHKRYEEAVDALKKEIEFYAACAEHHGMLDKLVMGLVMCHLKVGDYVAADNAFQGCLRYDGFVKSDECHSIQRLLTAFDEGDQEAADVELKSPLFRYMENDFTILARDLEVPGGRKKTKGLTADLEVEDTAEDDASDLLL